MEKKKSVSIDASLYEQIKSYCTTNGLKFNETIEEWIKKEFTIEKWGDIPSIFMEEPHNEVNKEKVNIKVKKNDEPINNPIIEKDNEIKTNNNLEGKKRRLK